VLVLEKIALELFFTLHIPIKAFKSSNSLSSFDLVAGFDEDEDDEDDDDDPPDVKTTGTFGDVIEDFFSSDPLLEVLLATGKLLMA
jgi:hypothetical protein